MIVNPVLIVGAPRSGTSMLQQILRNHPAFWSMPSESDIIWDQFCHPALHNWESEFLDRRNLTPADRDQILGLFEDYMRPASFWRPFESTNLIWGFRRMPVIRKFMRAVFKGVLPLITRLSSQDQEKRLLEKTASNCFRLDYVTEVFPDAKIIYPSRDGRNNVNSLINAWLHDKRFFTYDVPVDLDIGGYAHNRWKFVLPPGWRDYTKRSLAEVCAFQWQACHDAMLSEIARDKYKDRVFRIRLEDLVANPEAQLAALTDFLELPYDNYFKKVAADLPIVNSPDNNISIDKWRGENVEMIRQILPQIAPTMKRLGYELD